jgi:hypothetical protein
LRQFEQRLDRDKPLRRLVKECETHLQKQEM